jgi:hypothetical protein
VFVDDEKGEVMFLGIFDADDTVLLFAVPELERVEFEMIGQ